MNKEWSELNKTMQSQIKKRDTYDAGIETLFDLRNNLCQTIASFNEELSRDDFNAIPYINADGYHSKTLAYSIWHIFRIEDIVAHEMIVGDSQVLFDGDYLKRTGSPIITTGNELQGNEIAEFSKQLNINELYLYAKDVKESTDKILNGLSYKESKQRYGDDVKEKLILSKCVSEDENAFWLIDYWCGKDLKGLIQMPFSRHWIMHIEAMRRIKNKLCKIARKGVDPVAYCGFSCNHCFLAEWCGSCRTEYNTCSFATCSENRICPNVKCCKGKGIDGCYACDDLETCEKGFYIPSNDGANAAKAQALYIRKHGKKEFLKMHDRLHEKYDFQKTQEILGQDYKEGARILEEV